MPIFEVHCRHCDYQGELLVLSAETPMACPACGAANPEKRMSPTSPLSGKTRSRTPGPKDHGCCGNRPAEAGCAGPGSCCGHNRSV